MVERSKEEEERRTKERTMMEEGRALWMQKIKEDENQSKRDLNDINELARQRMFGRPGHGAPTVDIRKKKFTEHQLSDGLPRSVSMFKLDQEDEFVPAASRTMRNLEDSSSYLDLDVTDALKFGRPGCGAPVRTKSGRLKTIITGNPEIRFQNNESVQKTISNAIRYQTDRQEKSLYHRELDDQVKEKMLNKAAENQNNLEAAKHMEDTAGNEWGRPGPGGTYWRSSAVTGQGFYDKMGWSGSGDPRKRVWEVKRNEAEDMKRDMSYNAQRRHDEHLDVTSEVGIELVPLMKEKFTGKPKKDPKTGNMLSHGLSSTDVTKHADQKGSQPWHSTGNKQLYWDQLTGQVGEKQHKFMQRRNEDEEQQKLHFQSWESYWGRPGYGAPRNVTNKENLMKMLHYPSTVKNMPNNVELITLERLPVK
ncbi:uncharacterized protein LOC111714611 isoform X2 [Eurytemora carolleeae]|nr:uncharacterized protein LOC111714611 isoform X2 [Eurytemora carolleeae]|eukprot:XP_023345523.1 uncharacterized protein LOC111714611 isoform X2 [Eurytemora affinis]